MFVGKLLVDELVIDMDFSRTALIVLVEIIYGHIFDKVKAHLACKLSRSCIAFQTGNKFVNVLSCIQHTQPAKTSFQPDTFQAG